MSASALYLGAVVHARLRPVRHRLRYRMLNILLDLDEVAALGRRLVLFGHNRGALFSFHDADHGDGSATPLRAQIEALLRRAGLDPAGGRIRVLCMPRVLGMVFNPITVYFCHGADGALQAMLYEVNNTFGQRHSYLIPVTGDVRGALRQRCDKRFYVSPFMEMGLTYNFRVTLPDEALSLGIDVHDATGPLLFAAFAGRRRPLTDARLLAAFLSHPLLAARVLGGIHWEALKLWWKGMRPRPRPAPPAEPVTISSQGHTP
ncbi:DUF1365 family protein [Roseomonas sp. CAU 1739]|uniref:DUF1365 domain-containing protein n=1 Tax=Roseomonas sp. CAU 1739 TaxID=3140364 RepID=UPI00325ACAC0